MRQRGLFRSGRAATLFSLPQLVIVGIFFYYPAWIAVKYSVTLQKPFGGDAVYVGFDNYVALFASGELTSTLLVSLLFGICSTLFSIAIGLFLAILVCDRTDKTGIAQNVLIWPLAVAAPIAGVILQLILDPALGIGRLFDHWQPGTDPIDAFIQTVVSFAWIHIPLNFVILLAGLKAIPKQYLESAAIDGATRWRQIVDVRLPLLRPHTFLLLVLGMAESLTQSFGIIHTMTQGGPAGATNVLVYKIYSDGFEGLDLSGSATQSVVLMGIVILLTIAQFRFLERRIEYRR